jgi:catechol 2,3-dioxygenase-like lactoylglutathione lyase family enzyme
MLSHTYVGVTDFERSFAFYSAVFRELNVMLKFCEHEQVWAGWRPIDSDRPLFLIGMPYNSQPATPGNGQMVTLLAPCREAVDRCYASAIAAGAQCEGRPGLRPHYHPNFYGAYFSDPDGNKIGVCYHQPVSAAESCLGDAATVRPGQEHPGEKATKQHRRAGGPGKTQSR